ncbi:hypothetical protein ACVBEG_27340 [Pseudomonas sp. GG8]
MDNARDERTAYHQISLWAIFTALAIIFFGWAPGRLNFGDA